MPFFYNITPTSDVATSSSANTAVDHLRTLTVGRDVYVTGMYLVGKGQAQTSITGIQVYLQRMSTASSSGSSITPAPRNSDYPSATLTAFTGPTIGTTANIQLTIGMMSSGVGGWVQPDPDAAIFLVNGGGANGNLDLLSQTEGTVALNFHYNLETVER